jgi:Tetracyclin repressor-like, C-terminal domain
VLLELLAGSVREWIAHLEGELPSAVRRRAGLNRRAEQLARAIAKSLAERPVLCDLIGAQSAVLEHNVSVEAVTRHKLAGHAEAEVISRLVHDALPELDEDDVRKYVVAIWVLTAALWAYARPPEAVLQALAADERLAGMHLDFRAALEDYLTTLAIGLHSRRAR